MEVPWKGALARVKAPCFAHSLLYTIKGCQERKERAKDILLVYRYTFRIALGDSR